MRLSSNTETMPNTQPEINHPKHARGKDRGSAPLGTIELWTVWGQNQTADHAQTALGPS